MYDERLLRNEFTSCLTTHDENAPEAYIMTNIRDIGFRIYYNIKPQGWMQPLVNIQTGKFVLFVDNGKYRREPAKMMLKARFLPIFDTSDLLYGVSYRYPDDVNNFLDVIFPSWIEEKQFYARKIYELGKKYRRSKIYMPFFKVGNNYLTVGINNMSKRDFRFIDRGYKQYYETIESETEIVPPTIEMVAKLGLPVNPADWIVPEPDDEWIIRPLHTPIKDIPIGFYHKYMDLVRKINILIENPYVENPDGALCNLRLSEKKLIEFEIKVLRGADRDTLNFLLEESLMLFKPK